MGFAFRLMIFVIMFNLAVGVTIFIFGAQNWLNSLPTDTGITQVASLNNTYSQDTGNIPIDQQTLWYRFLDIISLGLYNKMRVFLNNTIFSIPTLLFRVGLLPEGLVGYVNGGITLVFIMGMFEIFTGKDISLR